TDRMFDITLFVRDTPATEISTLSLHDALPISWQEAMDRYGSDKPDLRYDLPIVDVSDLVGGSSFQVFSGAVERGGVVRGNTWKLDRKSTRLNSSHVAISYAVFCSKKKKTTARA